MKISRKWKRAWRLAKAEDSAKRSTRQLGLTAVFLTVLTIQSACWAMPQNGQVTIGQGQIMQNGSTMIVRQATNKMGINWQSFGIGKGETVRFIQPTASAVALNRVTGVDASVIYGKLSANGQVFLINPNGVLFAPGAQVNVGGLVASTLNLKDRDFAAGKYNFVGSSNGTVINQGSISAAGGYVVLAAAKVDNQGVITADNGGVALAAGKGMTVDVSGQGKINVVVDKAAINAAAANSGIIRANGGTVLMSVKAVGGVLDTVINQTGILEARSISTKNGVIMLDGGQSGAVISTGRLDASGRSPGQTGGTVKVLGDKVGLYGNAVVDVSGERGGGRVLIGGNVQGKGSEHNASQTVVGQAAALNADAIKSGNGGKVVVWASDSTKFYGTISAKGGANGGSGGFVETSGKNTLSMQGNVDASAVKGKQGQWLLDPRNVEIVSGASNSNADDTFTVTGDNAKISADKISAALSGTDVTITTGIDGEQNGDITVSAPITWSSDKALSLTAAGVIEVNSAITNTGKGNITLTAQSCYKDTSNPNYGAAVLFGSDGSISLSGGTAKISGAGDVRLGNITAGDLMVNSTLANGGISQNDDTVLHISGSTDLTSQAERRKIYLDNDGNSFGGPVSAHSLQADECGGFSLKSTQTTALQLGEIQLSGGKLKVTTNGSVVQTGPINAAGDITISAGSGQNIILANSGNHFYNIYVTATDKLLGNVTIVNANTSTVKEHKVYLPDSVGDLTLDYQSGLKIAKDKADIGDATTVNGNAKITAKGDITQAKGLVVSGTTDISQTNPHYGEVYLSNDNNSFAGQVTLHSLSTDFCDGNTIMSRQTTPLTIKADTVNDLTIATSGEIVFGDCKVGGSLEAAAAGISQTTTGKLQVAGEVSLEVNTSGNVKLGNAANQFSGVKDGIVSIMISSSTGDFGDIAICNAAQYNTVIALSGSTTAITVNNANLTEANGGLCFLGVNQDFAPIGISINGNLCMTASGKVRQTMEMDGEVWTSPWHVTGKADFITTSTQGSIILDNNNTFGKTLTLTTDKGLSITKPQTAGAVIIKPYSADGNIVLGNLADLPAYTPPDTYLHVAPDSLGKLNTNSLKIGGTEADRLDVVSDVNFLNTTLSANHINVLNKVTAANLTLSNADATGTANTIAIGSMSNGLNSSLDGFGNVTVQGNHTALSIYDNLSTGTYTYDIKPGLVKRQPAGGAAANVNYNNINKLTLQIGQSGGTANTVNTTFLTGIEQDLYGSNGLLSLDACALTLSGTTSPIVPGHGYGNITYTRFAQPTLANGTIYTPPSNPTKPTEPTTPLTPTPTLITQAPTYSAAVTQAQETVMQAFRIPITTAPNIKGFQGLPADRTDETGIANLTNKGLNLPQGVSGNTVSTPQGEADLSSPGMRMPSEQTEQKDNQIK